MDSKSAKNQQLDCLFALLGSACVKAEHRMLMKLSPGVNFINVLQAVFTGTDPKSAKKTDKSTVFFVLLGSVRVKASNKRQVKLIS